MAEAIPIPLDHDTAASSCHSPLRKRSGHIELKSNTRPSTRPKSRGHIDHVFPILTPLPQKQRATSRRKRQQWENKRLLSALFPGEFEEEFDVDIAVKDIFQQQWSSLFEKLDPLLLRSFRECEGEEYERALFQIKQKSKKEIKRSSLDAKKRFKMIDRKVRHHLLEAGLRMEGFIKGLESFLLLKLGFNSPICVNDVEPKDLDIALEKALVSAPVDVLEGILVEQPTLGVSICLKSSFHRLLAHGVAQFHGLMVRTEKISEEKKVMIIVNPIHCNIDESYKEDVDELEKSFEMISADEPLLIYKQSKNDKFNGRSFVSIISMIRLYSKGNSTSESKFHGF